MHDNAFLNLKDSSGRDNEYELRAVQERAFQLFKRKTWLCSGDFEVDGVNFHIPVPATYFISLPFLWQNCRRIFVMVLKGLSASKLRELVVQPISETTQSFQH